MSSSRSSYYGSPYVPVRSAERTSPTKAASPPSSPPRKVVTDFKAFGASPTASVFGTAVQSTPFSLAGGKAAFGGLRNNGRSTTFDDDDDDDDDGRQRVELREDSISLDQVRVPSFEFVNLPLTYGSRPHRRGALQCRAPGGALGCEQELCTACCDGSGCRLPMSRPHTPLVCYPLVRPCILISYHA